jgi:hypothetical protein
VLLRFDADEVRRLCRVASGAAGQACSHRPTRPMLLLRWQDGVRLEVPGTEAEPTWAIGWESWQADLETRADAAWSTRRPALLLALEQFAPCNDASCIAVELSLAGPAGPLRLAFLRRL